VDLDGRVLPWAETYRRAYRRGRHDFLEDQKIRARFQAQQGGAMSEPEDDDLTAAEMRYVETRKTELDTEINEAFHEPGALAEMREWVGRPALDPEALTIDDERAIVQASADIVSSHGNPELAREFISVYEQYLAAKAHLDDLLGADENQEMIDAAQAACDEIDEQVDRVEAAVRAYLKAKE